jgi:flavin reductase (DIM6/NTAB) family NADH-FMN oxidoreductase RutF
VSPAAFTRIVAGLDGPMFVVTTARNGERSGCLVGFAGQCSIEPPRFCVWISKTNHTFRVADDGATTAAVLAVHPLRAGDEPIARLFGETTGDDVDKFAQCSWEPGPKGVPVLSSCDWFAGEVIDRIDGGDHVGYVLELLDGGSAAHHREPQLGYQAVADLDAGHAP